MRTPDRTRDSREVHLAKRANGRREPSVIEIATVTLDEPNEGEVLVDNVYVSVAPYMRSPMSVRTPFNFKKTNDLAAMVGRRAPTGVDGYFDRVDDDREAALTNMNRRGRVVVTGT